MSSAVCPREQYSHDFHFPELTVKWEGDKLELFEQISPTQSHIAEVLWEPQSQWDLTWN